MFFYLSKALFSGFLQFKGNFVDGRNNSKYRDVAPLNSLITAQGHHCLFRATWQKGPHEHYELRDISVDDKVEYLAGKL